MKKMTRLLSVVLSLCLGLTIVGCAKPNGGDKLKVYAPDGAPALALSYVMHEYGSDYDFTVVVANQIGQQLTSGAADIAIVPTNAVANLFNKGNDYRIAAYATVGNLYLLGKGAQTLNLADLKGKRIGSIGQSAVPDAVLRGLLKANQLEYVAGDEAVANKVAVRYGADGANVRGMYTTGQVDYCLLGEPAATGSMNVINRDAEEADKVSLLDMQKARENYTGVYGFPQAVLVVKNATYTAKKAEVDAFIERYTAQDNWVETHTTEAVDAVKNHMADGTTASIQSLAPAVAKNCNISAKKVGAAERTAITTLLNDFIENDMTANIGGKLPDDTIYLYPAE